MKIRCASCLLGDVTALKNQSGWLGWQCNRCDQHPLVAIFPWTEEFWAPASATDAEPVTARSARFIQYVQHEPEIADYSPKNEGFPEFRVRKRPEPDDADFIVLDPFNGRIAAHGIRFRISVWCPRCRQGWVDRRETYFSEHPFWLCDECDALWPTDDVGYGHTMLDDYLWDPRRAERLRRFPRPSECLEIEWADGSIDRIRHG